MITIVRRWLVYFKNWKQKLFQTGPTQNRFVRWGVPHFYKFFSRILPIRCGTKSTECWLLTINCPIQNLLSPLRAHHHNLKSHLEPYLPNCLIFFVYSCYYNTHYHYQNDQTCCNCSTAPCFCWIPSLNLNFCFWFFELLSPSNLFWDSFLCIYCRYTFHHYTSL
jgi:hypothetical protein